MYFASGEQTKFENISVNSLLVVVKMSAAKNIYYSDKYTDDIYEYR